MDVTIRSSHHIQAVQSKKNHPQDYSQRPSDKPVDGPNLGPLPPFFTLDLKENEAVRKAMRKPLSGYLGGVESTGYWINALQDKWRQTFDCKYAIPCNSATSGLLAACMALGIGPGDVVWTSAYTMSATAACAKVLGARIVFIDIETMRFSMNMNKPTAPLPKCIIVTNLFGHPAYLASMRTWCDSNKVWMIEDNAQSPLAKEGNKYAGTVGHIGVFSLNVHKHIQAGEGGVVCTESEEWATNIRGAINHGELAGHLCGLNLRMTEQVAAIAYTQLDKAKKIIAGRVDFAHEISDMFSGIPWLRPPVQDIGCKHVYYIWAAIVKEKRDALVRALNKHGFPMRAGYSPTLNRIFKTADSCPAAESMEDKSLMTFEICAYNPPPKQRRVMREIAKRATGSV